MIYITRRDFLKYLTVSAVAMGYSSLNLARISDALAQSTKPPVVWLQGAGCNGCSISLLNSVGPTIDDVLLNTIDLQYHPTLMAAAGDLAITTATQALNTGFPLLIVEGAVPTAHSRYCTVWETFDGHHVTMLEAVQSLAPGSNHIRPRQAGSLLLAQSTPLRRVAF